MAKKKSSVASSTLLPDGFEPVSSKLDGWFLVEEGNSIQGRLRDVFVVNGQFGEKRVYKVEVTAGTTKTTTSEGDEAEATVGDLIGLDEKGWLKSLSNIKKDTEIFVRCLGREESARKGQQPAWKFLLGAVPSNKSEDNIPF